MNVAALLEKRRVQWNELEHICNAMEVRGKASKTGQPQHRGGPGVARFSTLYRAACADLALADAYQLPPATVTYLHRLVARAHNQLYRSNSLQPSSWYDIVFRDAPKLIYSDPCVRVATILFFGLFALSMFIGANETLFPDFATNVVGEAALESTESSFEHPIDADPSQYSAKAAFYIRHNTGIGLQCFAFGILIIPCLFTSAYNAIVLGTTFGYMSRPGIVGGDNFFEFVTAHGPFELTAIALAAGAGLRLGIGVFKTDGLCRTDSIRINAMRSVPIVSASATLFVMAAFTEGFLSPSGAPYLIKAGWAIFSSGLISFYFVILGMPNTTNPVSGLHTATYESVFGKDPPAASDDSDGSVINAT